MWNTQNKVPLTALGPACMVQYVEEDLPTRHLGDASRTMKKVCLGTIDRQSVPKNLVAL